MTVVDIQSIQSSLRDRMPRTSQQATNRIASKLSDNPNTAGTGNTAHVKTPDSDSDPNPHMMYMPGKTYGNGEKREVETYGPKKTYKPGRNLNTSWLRGVKGCFICGRDHRENEEHKPEESPPP